MNKELTFEKLFQLRLACSHLEECFKQEVYILNVMLAEVVRVKNIVAEKRDESLYVPIEARFVSKLEGAPRLGVEPTLKLVNAMLDVQNYTFAKACSEDEFVPKLLHQLELQLVRLTCRLGCSKEHAPLFHKALITFYKTYLHLRPHLTFQAKFEVLQVMMEELLRRNIHSHKTNSFFKILLNVLHEQRRHLKTLDVDSRKVPIDSGKDSGKDSSKEGLDRLPGADCNMRAAAATSSTVVKAGRKRQNADVIKEKNRENAEEEEDKDDGDKEEEEEQVKFLKYHLTNRCAM